VLRRSVEPATNCVRLKERETPLKPPAVKKRSISAAQRRGYKSQRKWSVEKVRGIVVEHGCVTTKDLKAASSSAYQWIHANDGPQAVGLIPSRASKKSIAA
jgi:hypothetical protein